LSRAHVALDLADIRTAPHFADRPSIRHYFVGHPFGNRGFERGAEAIERSLARDGIRIGEMAQMMVVRIDLP
jgi:hypothetical protein